MNRSEGDQDPWMLGVPREAEARGDKAGGRLAAHSRAPRTAQLLSTRRITPNCEETRPSHLESFMSHRN